MSRACYHFIGIGGIGMSGLARILLARGDSVSGSDITSNYVTEGLIQAGAKVHLGHSASHISQKATIVYSTDIKPDNPEYLQAQHLNCQLLHRSDLLMDLMKGHKTLAVAGTHGKTTTSSLLAHTLFFAGLNPGFAVGGIIKQFNANAAYGVGDYFVAEADESDGTFLKYEPYSAIITNIDLDHMNFFHTEEALIESFKQFADKVICKEKLLWCGDDPRLQKLDLPGISYGFNDKCQLRISNPRQFQWRLMFDIHFSGRLYYNVEVPMTGNHNVLNAAAVFGTAIVAGLSEPTVRESFTSFKGVKRRCEVKGNPREILILDDYAHHPVEIETTLKGIRNAIGTKRLVAIFQPHRYTRTRDCLGEYRSIFESADSTIITDIYSAGEPAIPGITHEKIVSEIAETTKNLHYVPRKELLAFLPTYLKPNDVVVTLGAGDITKLSQELVSALQNS